MSLLDKAIAAVTPPESEKDRADARKKARDAAGPSGWLASVLDHHLQIEDAFAEVKRASSAASRRAAQKALALVLTGHSIAEESVIYPALEASGEKGHSGMGYTEQAAVKVQMAALDELDPMSQDYLDKLEHIRGAVAHHVYEEEGTWFPKLQETSTPAAKARLTTKYAEEFNRYIGAA
jgi:hemerythrin superfamily protein